MNSRSLPGLRSQATRSAAGPEVAGQDHRQFSGRRRAEVIEPEFRAYRFAEDE